MLNKSIAILIVFTSIIYYACNVNDPASCVYPVANNTNFCEDFESASLSTNGWTTVSGSEGGVSIHLTSDNAIADTVSLEFTGGSVFYATQFSEALAFADPNHIASATVCLDFSSSVASVDMTFDAELSSVFANCAWFRVQVDGSVVPDKNGVTAFNDVTMTGLNSYAYDLSA